MHCAVQLSAFLYRAMYSTMQQQLTRTAVLKIKWSTDCLLNDTTEESAMNIHILILINTIWIHSSFTIVKNNYVFLFLLSNTFMPDTSLNLLKEAGDQIFKI